jgi:serine phosphatase RsbU (regulator of sigma subunit)/anti-sigma regulatory factor (Ser/Thr protein kinase)
MFRRPIREIVAAFPAQESQLAGLRKTVEEICRQVNLPTRDINNMVLAIEEGATNIIRHAYLYDDGEIRLKVALFKRSIIFSLYDTGKSFQPPDKSRLDLKTMAVSGRKGGLGFYLINKVMDRVEYFSLEGENEIRMIKFLSPDAEKDLEWTGGGTLRIRFSAWTLLIILILVAGGYYYLNSRSSRYIHSRLEKTVGALCSTIASQAYGYIINQRSDVEFDELVVSYERANDVLVSILVVDSSGHILADSRGPSKLHSVCDTSTMALITAGGTQTFFQANDSLAYAVRRIEFGGRILGNVVMAFSSQSVEAELSQTRRVILMITGIGLLIGILGIYFLSNYFVRPIGRIVDRVRRFAQGDLESQLPLTGAVEFYEISKALNELIMRIRRDRKNIVEREILQKEMQMAELIQKALIPSRLPVIQGYEIGTIYKAARMVGGDLFDVVRIDDTHFGVAVADVSGKGIPASLVMSMVRTALRLESRHNLSARDILIKLNDFVAEDIKQGMFVTIFLAVIETNTGKINIASAGHNPALHYECRSGEAHLLNPGGMPVGIKIDQVDFTQSIHEQNLTLDKDDILLIYTDGVTEGRGSNNTPYGSERLVELLKEHARLLPEAIARTIEDDIIRFIGKNDQHDDITMVILKNSGRENDPGATDMGKTDEVADSQTERNS